MEFKYQSIFANLQIKPLVSEEKDKYLSVASLNNLKKFLPDIDTSKNIDLLPIAFDACVVNRVNKNGDVINSNTAAEIVNNFINKPINVEHDRSNVIGCILTANFSKFGTNESMPAEEVKDLKEPFYITLGGVMWKVINPKLADLIEESNDPSSENYMKVSASWELGFSDYDIVLLEDNNKNIEDGKFITEEKEKDKLSKNLKAFGGTGKINNNTHIYRQVIGDVVPLGIGLTSNPAADVQGVATREIEKPKIISFKEKEDVGSKKENNISQNIKNDVIEEGVVNRIIMKIENINQITDDLLKEVKASSITDFIQEELKKASEAFVAEKNEKDNAIKAGQEKYEALSLESSKVKEELQKVKESLSKLEIERAAKAQQEAFNARMSLLDEEYDLSDEDRQVLASDIKDLNEEAFSSYMKKMAVLMKEKNKKNKRSKEEKEVKSSTNTEISASATEVVEEVIETTKLEKNSIPNSSTTVEPTLKEKFSKAFGFEGFEIK